MSLYYPELDEVKTKRIFKLNLGLIQKQFASQDRRITYDASSVEDFAGQHFKEHPYSRWNGRQIRNLCQTALALAEFDAQGGSIQSEVDKKVEVELQLKHFKSVQAAYIDFGEYLGKIRGTKGDRRAFDYGLRAKEPDTPYSTPTSRITQRADDMRRNAQQPNSMSASYNSAYDDPYLSPTHHRQTAGTSFGSGTPHGYPYPQGQPVGPMGNLGARTYEAHQVFGPPGEPLNRSDPRFYQTQLAQQNLDPAYGTSTQAWDPRHSPGGQTAQAFAPYAQRPQQYAHSEPQGPLFGNTGPGADVSGDKVDPAAMRRGHNFSVESERGVPLR